MKKALGLILALTLIMATFVPAFAADNGVDPYYDATSKIFFANGKAVTITDAAGDTLISWSGGSIIIPAADATSVDVFGGGDGRLAGASKGNNFASSSITMNGGTVRNLMGGSFMDSGVGSATIVVNGGSIVEYVMGGGEAICAGEGALNSAADAPTSNCYVNNARITVNGGSAGYGISGGPSSYGRTESSVITINDGTWPYVIAGGTNGHTGSGKIIMNGGTVDVLQGVNRGDIDSVSITVNGSTVDNLYLGGETDPSVTGTVDNSITATITGGTVNDLWTGTTNLLDMNDPANAAVVPPSTVKVAPGTVGTNHITDNITVATYVKPNPGNPGNSSSADTGWDGVLSRVRKAGSGDTVTYNMTKESQVPADVLQALKEASGVTLVLEHGDGTLRISSSQVKAIEAGRYYWSKADFIKLYSGSAPAAVTNPDTGAADMTGVVAAMILSAAVCGLTIKKRR